MSKIAIFVFILILIPIQNLALAICNDGIDAAAGAGTVVFGLVGVDDRMELAQSFLTDCDAQITQVTCRFFLEDATFNGIESAVIGDVLNCKVVNSAHETIMSKNFVITQAPGNYDVTFDFTSEEFMLVDDTYHYVISTPADKYCRLWWGEAYASGNASYISNGTWSAESGDFRSVVLWDSDSVFTPVDDHKWSYLKACYR